ncbi:MAG: MFS transporter, partial [Pseudobdellovibrionaceae bacterium]
MQTAKQSSNSFTPKEKKLLFILAAIQFCNIVDFMVMMPLGPQLMRLFSITPQQFGLLVSSYNLSAGLSGFVASFFIDRFDRKKALLFFVVGFSVGTLFCALSPRYEILLLARAATGIFGGVLGSLCFAIVGDAIHPDRRGQGTGTLMMSFSLASILGVPLSLYIAGRWNWHAPFFMIGLLGLLILIFIGQTMKPMRDHLVHIKAINPIADLKYILINPALVLGLIMSCFLVL